MLTYFKKDYIFVLISCRYDLVMRDKDLCLFSFLSLITVLHVLEADLWIKPKGFILGGVLPLGLDVEALTFLE